jgi:hypothetical protein
MIDDRGRDEGFTALDSSAGLYHEAQADGFPYDEDPGPLDEDPSRS